MIRFNLMNPAWTERQRMNDDFDGPWKEALQEYLPEFIAFFFPDLDDRIDWSRGFESLDQELLRISPEGATETGSVDKLYRVWDRSGAEHWLLIHIEVQSQARANFSRRMFRYNMAIFLAYDRLPISIGVLADDRTNWRPSSFRLEEAGTRVEFHFRTVKLLDFAEREEELRTSLNPFAVMVDAHLNTMRTRDNLAERGEIKFAISRSLFERGFSREQIEKIFRFMDWLMLLPPEINLNWWKRVETMKMESKPTFVPIWERLRIEYGEQVARDVTREVTENVTREVTDRVTKSVTERVQLEARLDNLREFVGRSLGIRFGDQTRSLIAELVKINSPQTLTEISDLLALGRSFEEIASRIRSETNDAD
jgi:hypothetical protein